MAHLMKCVLFSVFLPLHFKGAALLEAAKTNNSEAVARYLSVSMQKKIFTLHASMLHANAHKISCFCTYHIKVY